MEKFTDEQLYALRDSWDAVFVIQRGIFDHHLFKVQYFHYLRSCGLYDP